MSLDSILVPTVVSVSVPFSELHEHAYLYCSWFGTKLHCLPTNYGNHVEIFDILLLYHILFVSVFSLVSYRNMLLPTVLCCGTGRALFTNKVWESCCEIFDIILLYHILFVSIFSLVSYRNMLLPIVLCCGTGRALFTNKLSKQWYQVIKLYLCTKFCACKCLGY